MADVNLVSKSQLRSIAWLRWRMQVNALRTTSGKFEIGARFLSTSGWLLAGCGASIGLGFAAWGMMSRGRPEGIALLLWALLLYWQLLPILTSSAAQGLDAEGLPRFPLSYPAYFFVRMLYGSLDIISAVALLCLVGIWAGIGAADPALLPWTAVLLFAFGLMNILLARTVFAWIERWLQRRRTRELMSMLLLLLAIAPQIIVRVAAHSRANPEMLRIAVFLAPIEQLLPPGLAANGIAQALRGRVAGAALSLGALFLYAAVFGLLLHIRMRAQYRGENLSEAPSTSAAKPVQATNTAFTSSGLPAPIAAVIEKELRYFFRSGPLIFSLFVPLLLLFVFGPSRNRGWHLPAVLLFPVGAAYTLLTLPQLVYNSFGGEGAGVQFYFSAPVPLRTVLMAKNIFHAAIYMLQIAVLWVAVVLAFHAPRPDVLLGTMGWILFALPVNLAAGDLVSLYFPKRVDLVKFGRNRVSGMGALIGFAILGATIAVGGLVLFPFKSSGAFWPVLPVFLGLAVLSFAGYRFVLKWIDHVAARQMEPLVSELSRS